MIYNILIIICSTVLATLSIVFETKKDGKLTWFGYGAIIVPILLLLFSILAILKTDSEEKEKFDTNMLRFDTLVRKADTSFQKMDSSIDLQRQLQDSTRRLDSLAKIQLTLQNGLRMSTAILLDSNTLISRRTNTILGRTSDVLIQNSIINQDQKSTLVSIDRLVNGLEYPVGVFLSLRIPFRNPSLKNLIDTLYYLKSKMTKDPNFLSDLVTTQDSRGGEIRFLHLENAGLSILGAYKLLLGSSVLTFRTSSKYNYPGDDLLLELALRSSENDNGGRFNVTADLKSGFFSIQASYLCSPHTVKNNRISINELDNSFALFIPKTEEKLDYTIESISVSAVKSTSRIHLNDVSTSNVASEKNNRLFKVTIKN